jgi:hypothetical protein
MRSVKNKVLHKIQKSGRKPGALRLLRLWRGVLWLFAVAMLVCAGLSGALLVRVLVYGDFADAGLLAGGVLRQFVLLYGFVWLGASVFAWASAYMALRHTKYGYRWSLVRVMLWVLGAIALAGIALGLLGAPARAERALMRHFDMPGLDAVRAALWHAPGHGMLVGTFADDNFTTFIDKTGTLHKTDTTAVHQQGARVIRFIPQVVIAGYKDNERDVFVVCAARSLVGVSDAGLRERLRASGIARGAQRPVFEYIAKQSETNPDILRIKGCQWILDASINN